MKRYVIFAIVLFSIFTAYYLYTPYSTLNDIANTIEERDYEKLEDYIEFESVRESLKKDLNTYTRKVMMGALDDANAEPSMGTLLGGMIGSLFAENLGEIVIDFFVTPESLVMFFSGEIPDYENQESTKQRSGLSALEGAILRYDSLNRFLVIMNDGQEDQITLTMTRRGMGWSITEIDIFP